MAQDLTYNIFHENEKGSEERKRQHSVTIKFLEKSLPDLPETSSQAPYMRPWCSVRCVAPEMSVLYIANI
jgi:hypothetical protein